VTLALKRIVDALARWERSGGVGASGNVVKVKMEAQPTIRGEGGQKEIE
jgi:hypothetical protein